MNPQQADTMGAAPAPADPAASAKTVTLSANGDGTFHLITDAGDGQPPQEADAPDFETAMSQAGAALGAADDDDAAAAAATPAAAAPPAAGSY